MGVSAGLLIEAKANADAGDAYGRTPMHLAARMGHSAVVAVLALANAQVNAKQEVCDAVADLHDAKFLAIVNHPPAPSFSFLFASSPLCFFHTEPC